MTTVFTKLSKSPYSTRMPIKTLIAAAVLSSVISAQSFAKTETLQPAVGEVTLTLGEAYIIRADGDVIPVEVGTEVRVTDTIESGSGGFVHVRFVDNELVTVRPYSSMEVLRFEYNPQAPQNSVIKLNHLEGVTRYVSGEGAHNAKQNFRLNTPVAAIGVRGTDFVVASVDATTVRAFVNEGAIVMAPFSAACSADSLGPCSQDAIELSSLSQQILEMSTSAGGATVALLPANPAQAEQAVAEAVASTPPPAENKEKASKSDVYTDTVGSRAVNEKIVSTVTSTPKPPVVIDPPTVIPPEFTPDLALTASTLTDNSQLVWGRWYETNTTNERITVSYDTAIANNRQPTVGNVVHALFRVEKGPAVVQPGLGVMQFNLVQAQAHYNNGSGLQLMDVLGGNLSIDFVEERFATDLHLSHAATGNVDIYDYGILFGGGYFSSRSDTQVVAGAVSLDGKEAGYFFEKTLDSGTIEGLTLWGTTPK